MPADMRHSLLAGTALAALIAAAPAAFAQTAVNQTTTNSAATTNIGSIDIDAGTTGLGSSVTVTATGALSATSVTGIDQALNPPVGGFAGITQKSTNNAAGTVSNTGTVTAPVGVVLGSGSTISVGASGAAAALSVTGIAGATTKAFTAPTAGDIDQTATSAASVTNTATPNLPAAGAKVLLSGDGSSVAITASGAAASVGVTAINASTSFTMAPIGAIDQTANSTGANVTNTATAALHTGNLTGESASVSIGAAGATSATSFSFQNSAVTGSTVGSVTQKSTSSSSVSNTGVDLRTGTLTGKLASVSATATGAVSSLGVSTALGSLSGMTLGDVDQTATSTGATVSNTMPTLIVGTIAGEGNTVTVSATGAAASVSLTGTVANAATIGGYTVGTIDQTSSNTSVVSNTVSSKLQTASLSGDGSAVAAGASGAVVAISIGQMLGTLGASSVDTVTQSATNQAGATVTNSITKLTAGNIAGPGSSASISGSGAVASLSVTSITAKNMGQVTLSDITQTAKNIDGAISNTGTLLQVAKINGTGASAVISATGATSSVSVASIADTAYTAPLAGNITQSSTNGGTVTNSGAITLTNNASPLSGTGASAAISAVGAGAYTSFTAMK